jgi:hypothetical protein
MDGVPEMLIVVICGRDDLEFATTAVDALKYARLRWMSSGIPAWRSATSRPRF